MPIYEMMCSCGYEQNVMLAIKDRNKKIPCPKCTDIMIRKLSGITLIGMDAYGRSMINKN